jgi:phosphoglycolate phosphatase
LRCKHVVFDWNGTLLDDVGLAASCVNVVLGHYGMPAITTATYRSKFQFPIRSFYRDLGFDFGRPPFEEVIRRYLDAFDAQVLHCRLHEGAREVLQAFRDRGTTLYLLSATHEPQLRASVAHFGLEMFFADVLGLGDRNAHSKLELAQRLGVSLDSTPGKVAFVGDTLHDKEIADKMGWRAVLVTHGHDDHLRANSCDLEVIATLRELLSLL